ELAVQPARPPSVAPAAGNTPTPPPAAMVPEKAETAEPAQPPSAAPSPENPPAAENSPASAPTATEEAATPPPAAEESKPEQGKATTVGLVAVQLGAAASEAKATGKWHHLQKQLPELLASREPVIQKVEHNGHASWQLRTGGFADRPQASAFCKKVHASGVACEVLAAE